MGVHQVFSSTLPRPEHVSLSKHVDSGDVHPNIPPELIGLVVSAKASFLHLINQHTDGNKPRMFAVGIYWVMSTQEYDTECSIKITTLSP